MDPLSQGLLGAALAASLSVKRTKETKNANLKVASICGAIGGMSPDLDIFIRSASDPLIAIEFHRHFTHSLIFIPIGGLIIALALWGLFFRKRAFKPIYIFTTLGFATHGFLDACTSYGTRLLWPFSDLRISWNIISIIDPIFTLTLLIFLCLSLFRRSVILMRIGLCLSLAYLSFGYIKHEQVRGFIENIARDRGHEIERILLNPTIGNNIVWRSVYKAGESYYIDAVYAQLLTNPILHEGLKVPVINAEKVFPELGKNSVQREDIRRFSYFSQGYIYRHPEYKNMIADLRYGTLPYDNKSLWGIEIDPENPQNHVKFKNLRKMNDKHYDEFWLMLNGEFFKNDAR